MFSDDDIIQSVKEGKIQNFEIIINRYKNPIINFIHKMIFDYEEAQSLTQDVFLKIFENLKRYKMEANFHAFIFTIAKNLTLNYIKKNKRIQFFSNFGSKNPENYLYNDENSQEKIHENKIREQQIISGLKALKENQRIALILKVYMGFSYKKIAEITDWSIPKIETLISRAKIELKNIIFLQENKNANV